MDEKACEASRQRPCSADRGLPPAGERARAVGSSAAHRGGSRYRNGVHFRVLGEGAKTNVREATNPHININGTVEHLAMRGDIDLDKIYTIELERKIERALIIKNRKI